MTTAATPTPADRPPPASTSQPPPAEERAGDVIVERFPCPACNYELVGLRTGRPCPECGQTIPGAEPDESQITLAGVVRTLRDLGPAALLGVVWAVLPVLGSIVLFARLGSVEAWLMSFGLIAGGAIFAAMFAVTSGLGLLPTYAQAILAGWAFGTVVGTAWALLGILGGSLIGMAIARHAGRRQVEQALAGKPKWKAVRDALVKSGRWRTLGIVTLIRVPPNSPFSLTNLVLTVSGVPLLTYIAATAVGILPRTAVVVTLGSGLNAALTEADPAATLTEEAVRESRPIWLVVVGIASAIAVLVVLSRIAERALQKLAHDVGRDEAAEGRIDAGAVQG